MDALCNFTPYIDYSALIFLSGLLLCLSLSKQLYSKFYTVRIASLQGNHGYFAQKQKHDKMKLENI